MSGYDYQHEIHAALEQAKTYIHSGNRDGAIEMVDHAVKLIEAEWNALLAEIHDLERAS